MTQHAHRATSPEWRINGCTKDGLTIIATTDLAYPEWVAYAEATNAAYIVKAVNCHAELVEALKELRYQLWLLAKDPHNNAWIKQANTILAKAGAA